MKGSTGMCLPNTPVDRGGRFCAYHISHRVEWERSSMRGQRACHPARVQMGVNSEPTPSAKGAAGAPSTTRRLLPLPHLVHR